MARGPVGSISGESTASTCLPVTPSLSARGSGPRSGQRFRAALTELLSWVWAMRQTSEPALVSVGQRLDAPGVPAASSLCGNTPAPPPPDRKALKPLASSSDSCSLSLTARPLPAWLPALPHPAPHRPGGPQRFLAESQTAWPRGRVPATPSLAHHPGSLHRAWAGAAVRCRPRCST